MILIPLPCIQLSMYKIFQTLVYAVSGLASLCGLKKEDTSQKKKIHARLHLLFVKKSAVSAVSADSSGGLKKRNKREKTKNFFHATNFLSKSQRFQRFQRIFMVVWKKRTRHKKKMHACLHLLFVKKSAVSADFYGGLKKETRNIKKKDPCLAIDYLLESHRNLLVD